MRPHSPPSHPRPTRQFLIVAASDGAPSDGSTSQNNALDDEPAFTWSFLSKHAHVLICLQKNPQIRVRQLAAKVGLSPRAVLRTLDDLESAQYITRQRDRRGSRYEVHPQQARCSPVVGDLKLDDLVQMFGGDAPARK